MWRKKNGGNRTDDERAVERRNKQQIEAQRKHDKLLKRDMLRSESPTSKVSDNLTEGRMTPNSSKMRKFKSVPDP